MKRKAKLIGLGVMLFASFIFLSAYGSTGSDGKAWKAPKSADKLKNSLKGNADATEKGEELYTQMCAICHGEEGEGDGIAGGALKPRPANFTTKKVQSQTDGAIFWKITEGRSPMASYKEVLKEEQRWQLVNYIRTFKK